jgi:hypothetical protein
MVVEWIAFNGKERPRKGMDAHQQGGKLGVLRPGAALDRKLNTYLEPERLDPGTT